MARKRIVVHKRKKVGQRPAFSPAERIRAMSLEYALGLRGKKGQPIRPVPIAPIVVRSEATKTAMPPVDRRPYSPSWLQGLPKKDRKTKGARRAARKAAKQSRWKQNYEDYMRSEEWRSFRLKIYAQRGARCERCASTLMLHVHHKTYARFGKEKPEDVEILCGSCHEKHHGRTFSDNGLTPLQQKQELRKR